ncbi:ArsR family transcriptional regulator [Candidatus Pacearchaeota archaeon]|nr:ArsR family transcriptional regulator [Candidatus Pacearchaeota archaeon]
MDSKILEEAGLSRGEAEIYLILLKIGEATASQIAKHTKIARPNVYDYLNKLRKKELISFINKNNKTHYIPSDPEKIVDYMDEKKERILNNLDSLLNIYQSKKEMPLVEVYEGVEGFKTLMNDIIKVGQNFVGWGGSDKVRNYLPDYVVDRYLLLRKKNNIKGKMLYVEQESPLKTELTSFKKIPTEFASPSTTLIYGDRVASMIYTLIPVIIIIKSRELSNSYKKHFELLWKRAK